MVIIASVAAAADLLFRHTGDPNPLGYQTRSFRLKGNSGRNRASGPTAREEYPRAGLGNGHGARELLSLEISGSSEPLVVSFMRGVGD